MTDLEFNLFFGIEPKDPFKDLANVYLKEFHKSPQGRAYQNTYIKNRIKTDKNFRLRCSLSSSLNSILKLRGYSKSEPTLKLIGCSIEFLKSYLASKFTPGMTWNNRGTGANGRGMQEWHIDHIIPCSSFDLSKPSEQSKCFHCTNLQPLWAKDNLAKSNKCSF